MLDHSREDKQAPHHPDPQKKGATVTTTHNPSPPTPPSEDTPRDKEDGENLILPTTARTTRRQHQVLAAQVSDIIDTHWNKARATTPSTKSPPNPYPGVPHYPPRTQIRAPHSNTQQTTTCTSGQAKEERHRHTKVTQGTEPNTPHLGWHTFAPSHTLNDTHLHTHHPTRLMPTRNNPPQPQEDTPQGDLQPGRQNQTDQTQRRTTTSNQPRPTSTQTPTTAKDTTRSLTKSP